MCLSVCLSAYISRKPHGRTSPDLLYVLPVAMAGSFSGGDALRNVLPVLWTTSYFPIVGPMARRVYS